jgi:hypothetical protein
MKPLPPEMTTPIDPSLKAYCLDVDRTDWGDLLAPFSPPIPQQAEIILASYFGDVFMVVADGSVMWVNPQMLRVDTIARTKDEFLSRLYNERDAFLKVLLVDHMARLDKNIRIGFLYGLKQMKEAFAFWGAEFRKQQPPSPGGPAPVLSAGIGGRLASGKPDEKSKKKGWFN